jgi:hypothetical protein
MHLLQNRLPRLGKARGKFSRFEEDRKEWLVDDNMVLTPGERNNWAEGPKSLGSASIQLEIPARIINAID